MAFDSPLFEESVVGREPRRLEVPYEPDGERLVGTVNDDLDVVDERCE